MSFQYVKNAEEKVVFGIYCITFDLKHLKEIGLLVDIVDVVL